MQLITATSTLPDFTVIFSPEIDLSDMRREIAFSSISATNSIPNITATANSFQVGRTGQQPKTVSLPIGSYDMKAIQRHFKAHAGARLEANSATFHIVINVPADTVISFNVPNSIAPVLGFEKDSVLNPGMRSSDHVAKIVPVNTVNVCCDVVTGSYVDGVLATSLFTFYPDVHPGAKIVKEARQLIYLPFSDSRKEKLSKIRVSLTDQNNRVIDFRGEPITVTFFLR